jgi:serine/threonine-protein kinase RsbW
MSPVSVKEGLRQLPTGHISLRLPARAEYIGLCRSLAATVAEMCRLDQSTITDLKLAVTEACGNVVRHAYPRSSSPAEMEVECSVGGDRIAIAVRDWGRGFDRPDDAPDTTGAGFGLRMIEALAEDVEVEERADGTTIRFARSIDPPS